MKRGRKPPRQSSRRLRREKPRLVAGLLVPGSPNLLPCGSFQGFRERLRKLQGRFLALGGGPKENTLRFQVKRVDVGLDGGLVRTERVRRSLKLHFDVPVRLEFGKDEDHARAVGLSQAKETGGVRLGL